MRQVDSIESISINLLSFFTPHLLEEYTCTQDLDRLEVIFKRIEPLNMKINNFLIGNFDTSMYLLHCCSLYRYTIKKTNIEKSNTLIDIKISQ